MNGGWNKIKIDLQHVAQLRARGLQLRDVAIEIGCSCGTLRRRLRAAGVPPVHQQKSHNRAQVDTDRVQHWLSDGWTRQECADALGVGVSTLNRHLRAAGVPATGVRRADIDLKQVALWRQDGWTWRECACALGVNVSTLRRHRVAAGEQMHIGGKLKLVDLDLCDALRADGHTQDDTAQILGISRDTLRKRLRERASRRDENAAVACDAAQAVEPIAGPLPETRQVGCG